MNPDVIDIEFRKAILVTGAYKQMGISHQHQKLLRNHLKRGIQISIEKKIRLLQKTGWRSDQFIYSRTDMVNFAIFILKQGSSAKTLGGEYLLDKFEITNGTQIT
jgi:hypothetical protein